MSRCSSLPKALNSWRLDVRLLSKRCRRCASSSPGCSQVEQLLRLAPQQLFAHFRLEGIERIKILHPTLRSDKGIIGAEHETHVSCLCHHWISCGTTGCLEMSRQ